VAFAPCDLARCSHLAEGRSWLRRLKAPLNQRLTLSQHREILVVRQQAETTRRAALSLGIDTEHGEITARAHEMRAWMALTTGDYHGVAGS